jgi:hypothetical protein
VEAHCTDCSVFNQLISLALAKKISALRTKEFLRERGARKPAYHLRGRIVLSDGKPIANGMTVTISSEKAFDSQTATLPPSGRFEFVGLAEGRVFASVKGYAPPPVAPVSIKGSQVTLKRNFSPNQTLKERTKLRFVASQSINDQTEAWNVLEVVSVSS